MSITLQQIKWTLGTMRKAPWNAMRSIMLCRQKKVSVLFFTQHKCASTFIPSLLNGICRMSGDLKCVDYSHIIGQTGWIFDFGKRFAKEEEFFEQNAQRLFKREGFIYGPFRTPFFVPNWQAYKAIYFLRDPRDSLISLYYSFGRTHPIPLDRKTGERFVKERKKIQNETIDEFCIRMATEWSKPLLSYYKKMISLSLTPPLVLTYENYVQNTHETIKRIFLYCDVTDKTNMITALAKKAAPVQPQISETSHRRSGKIGQSKYELKSDTICIIETILKDEIIFFGWK